LAWYSADPAQEALDHPLIMPVFAAAGDVAAEPVPLLVLPPLLPLLLLLLLLVPTG
jgi:hypothetical protein